MQHAIDLARRKMLAAAALAFVAGAALLGYTAATYLAAPSPAAPPEPPLALAEEPPLPELGIEPGLEGEQPTGEASAPDELIVYVSGAVRAPDVYRLPVAARVKDGLLAAGGPAPDANLDQINLAAPLADGQQIVVPRHGDAAATAEPDAPAEPDPAAGPGLLNLNTATAAQLDALPGIGPAIAERIIARREASGPFHAVEDLQDVPGVGAALIDKIAPLVTVE